MSKDEGGDEGSDEVGEENDFMLPEGFWLQTDKLTLMIVDFATEKLLGNSSRDHFHILCPLRGVQCVWGHGYLASNVYDQPCVIWPSPSNHDLQPVTS